MPNRENRPKSKVNLDNCLPSVFQVIEYPGTVEYNDRPIDFVVTIRIPVYRAHFLSPGKKITRPVYSFNFGQWELALPHEDRMELENLIIKAALARGILDKDMRLVPNTQ